VKNGLWTYFYDDPVLTTPEFPSDVDTTSTAYLSIPERYHSESADSELILNKMADNRSSDGIMQTYFSDERPRTSPEVCCNIIRAFHRFGKSSDPRIKKTEEWVVRCLKNKTYYYGSRVYTVPEAFLYFAARLYVEYEKGPLKE
jgi:hypothetical protein